MGETTGNFHEYFARKIKRPTSHDSIPEFQEAQVSRRYRLETEILAQGLRNYTFLASAGADLILRQ